VRENILIMKKRKTNLPQKTGDKKVEDLIKMSKFTYKKTRIYSTKQRIFLICLAIITATCFFASTVL
jgi:hypothetical protein